MNSISEIPSLPDGQVLPFLKGVIDTVFEVKTGKNSRGKPYKKQGFLLSAPSGKVMVETFIQSLFQTEDDVGKELHLVSTHTDQGFVGIVKSSYTTKPGPDDNPETFVPEKKHTVSLESGTKIFDPAKQPKKPEPVTTPPAPPSFHPDVLKKARQWFCCFDAVNSVAPAGMEIGLRKDIATAVFIECQRQGAKQFGAPTHGNEPPSSKPETPPATPVQPATEPPKPPTKPSSPPEQPKKLSNADINRIGTKVLSEQAITAKELDGIDLWPIYKACYGEARLEIPEEFLDASYADCEKRKNKDERNTLLAILTNWSIYLADARKRMETKKQEAELAEMPADVDL